MITPQSRSLALPFAVSCLAVLLFAIMDATMKGLSLSVGLFNALFWRALAGTLLGLAVMLPGGHRWPKRAVLRLHILRGAVVTLMASLFFFALMRMPLAEAIALSFIAPLIALYLAALLLGERIGKRAISASLLGLVGVAVILSGRMQDSYDWDALLGAAAVLVSAVLFAWNLIIQRQQAQLASPVEVAFFQHGVMFILFGLCAITAWAAPGLVPLRLDLPRPDSFLLIAGCAGFAFTSLAAFAWAYARAEAQHLIPVEYTAIIWAAIIGWLAFGELLTLPTIAGAALIVAGCLIALRSAPPAQVHEGIA